MNGPTTSVRSQTSEAAKKIREQILDAAEDSPHVLRDVVVERKTATTDVTVANANQSVETVNEARGPLFTRHSLSASVVTMSTRN